MADNGADSLPVFDKDTNSLGSSKEAETELKKGLSDREKMEHRSVEEPSQATFSFVDEDHTLANSVRFSLNQDPRVAFCGYSIPHPSEARVNIRVQTTGDPAREVLNDACYSLMFMCQHVRKTFDKSVEDFKRNDAMEMETT